MIDKYDNAISPTDYTITTHDDFTHDDFTHDDFTHCIRKDGVITAMCFGVESCLHAIWVEEGKNQNHFYAYNQGKVSRVDRGIL